MMCDCSYLKSEKEIKEFLIDELGDDIERNVDEPDIVMEDTKALMKLARDKMTLKEIIEELLTYQYKVIDLLKLQRDLEDVKNYFLDEHKEYVGNICETIEQINRMVNKNV
jgi:hypothetical protein